MMRSLVSVFHYDLYQVSCCFLNLLTGTKGKLGEDVGQPGIGAGDTRVSHMSHKG